MTDTEADTTPPTGGDATVDVVVVSYNQRRRLVECLESVLDATSARVIVVDNASDDGSLDAARQLIPESDCLPMDDNLGFAAGVNRGAAHGCAPFILLLNNDARLRTGALDALRAQLADSRVAAAGPRLRGSNGQLELSVDRTLSPWSEAKFRLIESLYRDGRGPLGGRLDRRYAASRDVASLSGACMLLRRTAFEEIGGFDERFFLYAEDVDLCRRLGAAGYTLRYAADAVVDHARGASSAVDPTASTLAYRRSQMAFYRKHHGALAAQGLRFYLACRFAFQRVFGRGNKRRLAATLLHWTLRQSGS